MFDVLFDIAFGQGIYFARDAATSYGYTHTDARGLRHMFLGNHKIFHSIDELNLYFSSCLGR